VGFTPRFSGRGWGLIEGLRGEVVIGGELQK
jgi:hypothetical protein